MSAGRVIGAAFAALALAGVATADGAPPQRPERVVSINLCTDQLALLLAAPGQLISVSNMAHDPLSSAMIEAASGVPENYGRAEEVWMLRPDLVLAGAFTPEPTVAMLRRLGLKVARFPAAATMADVAANMRLMGEALGREKAAEAEIAAFEARLAALPIGHGRRPRAALYQASGWTVGDATLAGRILARAGFANLAEDFAIDYGGVIPLEALVMAAPDIIVTGTRYAGASRAEEVPRHPALTTLNRVQATDSDWICGAPHVLDAVEAMAAARRRLEPGG
ncbi:ABC transporter substrate-binding protein [Pikeienuella piscinae]|uniref:ABC transporter substrate-binding protein n=1 Tax=Pikeienuella piscinae TaxID=2748098 RepID=A0A7L5BZ91_9RHOB|nr:ABC transporter substrate-binding protein [Pikeienuella piscinae]QIE57052.1 ABC transporter substrate-binding protein [Pikeienuella piscinae]